MPVKRGRHQIVMNDTLWKKAQECAEAEGKSVSALLRELVAERMASDHVLFLTHREARSLLGGLEREENRCGSLSDSRTRIKKRLTDMLGGENWRALW